MDMTRRVPEPARSEPGIDEIEQLFHPHPAMQDQRAGHHQPHHDVPGRVILAGSHTPQMLTADVGHTRELRGADAIRLDERFERRHDYQYTGWEFVGRSRHSVW